MNYFTKQLSNKKVVELLENEDSEYWEKEREKNSITLFQEASKKVPAYKDFLKKNRIDPEKIKTWKDFQLVPPVSKKNYLKQYPLKELCWDGTLKKPFVFTSTSGSTGEPFYFMRQEVLDWQYSFIIDSFLKATSDPYKKSTLVVICFGMGIWIGGLMTYKGYEIIANENNYPLSIITPGLSKKEIMKILELLAPQYDQTILVGYAPFIKDIVDEALSNGIDLSKLNLKMHFAAEAISEQFRDYLFQKAKLNNIYTDIINIYGSADIGAMAVENAVSILVKRLSKKNDKLFYDIFSPIHKTPTLAQFNPLFINFEAPSGEILLTGDSALPLVRYAIGDHGGVFSYNDTVSKLHNYKIDLNSEIQKAGLARDVYKLPFVYVYERIDLSASLYGLLIYPEWIKGSLLNGEISNYLTSKFSLIIKHDEQLSQYLEINLEVKKDKHITDELKKEILKKIINSLRSNSSEYKELYDKIKERAYPKLNFWPAGDPTYFTEGIKQKWTIK